MDWLNRSDVVLLVAAAYTAVMALVRLMQRRRDELVADVQQQVEARRHRTKRASGEDQPKRGAA